MAIPPDPPVTKPAAPTGKGSSKPTGTAATRLPSYADLYGSMTNTPTYADLHPIALRDAQATVAGQVAYINQLRAQALAEGRQRGTDILGASSAAAKLLLPLGGQAADAYQAAAAGQTGLAQGFTGQLRTDAEAQAAAAQQTAQAAGGSAGQVPDVSAPLANLLYGLSGKIPGDALAVQGLGAVRDAQTLPAQTLGYGQQEAAGAYGAGAQAAQQLVAELVKARGELPGLTAENLAGLQKASQDSLTNRREALGTLSLIGSRDAAAKAANRRGDIAEFNALTSRAAAKARAEQATANAQSLADYRAGRLSIDELRTQVYATAQATSAKIRTAQLGISRQNAATSVFNANTSRINAGTASRRAAIALAAAKAKAAGGGRTPGQIATARKTAHSLADQAYFGVQPKPHWDGFKYVTVPGPGESGFNEAVFLGLGGKYQQTYDDAFADIKAQTSLPDRVIYAYLNEFYAPGELGRPQTKAAAAANAAAVKKVGEILSFGG